MVPQNEEAKPLPTKESGIIGYNSDIIIFMFYHRDMMGMKSCQVVNELVLESLLEHIIPCEPLEKMWQNRTV